MSTKVLANNSYSYRLLIEPVKIFPPSVTRNRCERYLCTEPWNFPNVTHTKQKLCM